MTIQELINALIIIRDDPCSEGALTPIYLDGGGYDGPQDIKCVAVSNGECVIEG